MPLTKTPGIGHAPDESRKPAKLRPRRRQVIAALGGAAATALLAPSPAIAAASAIVTPRQALGPFYPRDWMGDIDNDLVRVTGAAASAMGQITHISGRLMDVTGSPVAGAVIEIWQCDVNGRYLHPGDRGRNIARDGNFQGRGRFITGSDGRYQFRTIRPVTYPGRTPHIHFLVRTKDGRRLITQMYVAGEQLNERDFLLGHIGDPRQRASVIVPLETADRIEPGALAGQFDIVLG